MNNNHSYPTVSKADVADSILQLFEGPIRQKIDEWTDQSMIQLLEWLRDKDALNYNSILSNSLVLSAQEILHAFKTNPR